MTLVSLPPDVLEERLQEARRTYKLNIGYAGLTQLPPGFVEQVKKYNPHITELELSSNQLSDLPEDLEQFRYLRTLRLKYNQLKRLPNVASKLPQLMVLELSGNGISKLEESVAQMSMLKELDLSGNALTELPDGICALPKLEMLQLENNRLEVLPEAIGDLPSLTKLDISTNNLRYLPASMGRFRKIQRIDAANNVLVKVPPSMGHLKTLKEFNLRYNHLDERYQAKVEEGLSRLMAFLRDEEERERLEEIERLKPIGTPVGCYLEYRCKAEIGQVVKTEVGEITVDNRCWIRSGHSLTQVGNMLIIFGGVLVKDGTTTNDVFWMTMERMEWHNQPTKGDKPYPRYGHCSVFDEDNNRLVIFGGRTAERRRLNDVYYLDMDTYTWHKPTTKDTAPAPREQAVAAYWGGFGQMVIFGGHASGGRSNDLFLLDLTTWSWEQPTTTGSTPAPRQACAMCFGHGNMLFVHGGRNNFVLEDLYVLDFKTKIWAEITCQGRSPPPRHSHLLTVYKDHLYLMGGQDELGAHSYAMYRLPMPEGENYASVRPEWLEWDSELPYNKNRSYAFWQGSISIYQLGSNTLGRVNDEDAEKGLVYWDVFKTARLDHLKPRQLDEEELKPKNAKRVRIQHTINIASRMPKSFTQHTAQEQKVMDYVQDFKRIFEELYPHRRPLYLTPRNECNTPKFVCSSIRPTQLSFTELYDLDGCCRFVADFLAYEALEDPLHPPEYLPSPMSVLNWQAGDCFDMAVVLASLLIGVGFNAFVVVGYGPNSITTNDQTRLECPVLEAERLAALRAEQPPPEEPKKDKEKEKKAAEKDKEKGDKEGGEVTKEEEVKKGPKYQIKKPAVLKSTLKSKLEAEDLLPRSSTGNGAANDNGSAALGDRQEASSVCKTMHAWVLVMSGKREVTENMFIEPSTGRKYSLKACPYEGVEFLWNHRNFWVCLQLAAPHSDARANPKDISYELGDHSKWEAVFESNMMRQYMGDQADEESLKLIEGRHLTTSQSNKNATINKPRTPSALPRQQTTLGGAVPPTPNSKTRLTTPTNPSLGAGGDGNGVRASHYGDSTTPPRTAESHAHSHGGVTGGGGGDSGWSNNGAVDEESTDQELTPDMPPSWVPRLFIPRDAFDMRCPRGTKMTQYNKCLLEIFALFGECSRWDGMVEKLTVYEDDEHTATRETREKFNRRKDKLRERRQYPQRETSIEYFDPGSALCLKDIHHVKNVRRVMTFYHTARLDGLIQREEVTGRKLIETFTGRDDHLVYRSATYLEQPDDMQEDDEDFSEDDGAKKLRKGKDGTEKKRTLPIRKMTEKFSRNPALPASKDVAKRVYYLSEHRLRVEFHFGENHITNSSRTFSKDGHSHIVQVDQLADQPKPSALLEEFQALVASEKACLDAVRESEWEVNEILKTRIVQEQNIVLETPYYDIVRIKAEESEEEEEEEKETAYDYLSPFLPINIATQTMSREQALEVREKCLRSLKDRLIERANIIQARLDEEHASLAKRQANFNRDRDQMSQEEEEEYERACEDSMFKIQILEKRLKRHEEQALSKYYELDHRLRDDPRLRSLLQL